MSSGLYHIAANCTVNSLIATAAAGLTMAIWSGDDESARHGQSQDTTAAADVSN
jgi:hypothetical protein